MGGWKGRKNWKRVWKVREGRTVGDGNEEWEGKERVEWGGMGRRLGKVETLNGGGVVQWRGGGSGWGKWRKGVAKGRGVKGREEQGGVKVGD